MNEKDLEQLFISNKFKGKSPILQIAKFLISALVIFAIIYSGINYNAFYQKIKFWYRDEFLQSEKPLSLVVHRQNANPGEEKTFPAIGENSIYIERTDIRAPIIFSVENEEGSINNGLKKGVVHIAGTSLPGEIGNIFITGHSSNFPWVQSKYNAVFALLDQEVVGDLIMINFNKTNYVYQIEEKMVVGPYETSVMDNYASYPTLTLMTCTPVGTNLQRLIIRAKQIIPDINYDAKKTNQENHQLPSGVR